MQTLFVTGASSAIGQSIVRALPPNVQILALEHRHPVASSHPNIRRLAGGLESIQNHAEEIRSAKVVLHLAGITHSNIESRYFDINHRATCQLLSTCHPTQNFIYVSTRCVGKEGGGYSESKELAEDAVRASGLPFTIIRPAEIYGSSSEGIDALVQLAARFRVLIDLRARPEISYSPVSRDEFADFVCALIRSDVQGGKTYTICNDRDYTSSDIRAAIEERLGGSILRLPVPLRWLEVLQSLRIPLPFKRDQLARLTMAKSSDNSQAKRDYGFAPRSFLDFLRGEASL